MGGGAGEKIRAAGLAGWAGPTHFSGMTQSNRRGGIFVGWACLAVTGLAVAGPPPEQAELAERLLQTGQRLAASRDAAPVAATLADIADRLYENDARLLRTSIELRLSLGQREKAIGLLTSLRKLDPADQIAQVQSIDLQQSKMQVVTERADYLGRIASNERISGEVRAHAAVLLANVELERGRDDAAKAAVDQALGLNPLNPKALRMHADAMAVGGTAPQRTAAWVGLLRADPLQFPTASRLGEELLRAGLIEPATDHYRKFFAALDASGYGPGPEDAINFAHLLWVGSKLPEAQSIVADAIKDFPTDMRLHMARVILAEAGNDMAATKAAVGDARTQATRNLMAMHQHLDQSAKPLDESSAVALPDVKADAELARKSDQRTADAELKALGDLAWLDATFGTPVDPAVLEAIKTLAGEDSAIVHRLAGYAALATGRLDEADVAFSPVAKTDGLSRLGLAAVKLKKGGDKAAAVADGNALLAEMSTDIGGLLVRRTLQDAGPLSYKAADADAVAAEAAKLPRDTFSFPTGGQALYIVDADPIGGSLEIGAPILVKATIQNIGDRPLAIGPGGAVAQGVSLDATVRGVIEQPFAGAAMAKFTNKLVLKPRESMSTTVRLDSPELAAFLASFPQAAASIFVSAVTNPVNRQNVILPGPGGFRRQSRGVIDRPQIAYIRPEVQQQLAKQAESPDAVRRLRAVDALSACAMQLSRVTETQPLAQQAAAILRKLAQGDPSTLVKAAAQQELVGLVQDADKPALIAMMVAAPGLESRTLGCLLAANRPKPEREKLLAAMTADSDDALRTLASAVLALPDAPPATQPAAATQPAS